jgi:hypothetical protein
LDEQLSALLQSVEEDPPKNAPLAAPYVLTSAQARPLGRARTATRRVDPIVRDRLVLIFAGVLLGILVAVVVVWFQDGALVIR